MDNVDKILDKCDKEKWCINATKHDKIVLCKLS